jgi:hypothetical protein
MSDLPEKLDYAAMQARLDAAVAKNLTIIPYVRFDFEGFDAIGYQVMGIHDPKERLAWLEDQFNGFVESLSALKDGDRVFGSFMTRSQENPSETEGEKSPPA